MRTDNLLDGRWIHATDDRTFPVTDPSTDAILARVPACGVVETRRAIDVADRVFPAWASTPAAERARILRQLGERLMAGTEHLASIISAENGKPLREARAEVAYAASFLPSAAEAISSAADETIHAPGRQVEVRYRPVGVSAAITPWNFPLAMLAKKVAPSLAAGCPLIVKPAEATPLSAIAFGELAMEAGVPAGVLAILTGDPEPIAQTILGDGRVRKLSFTGSTEVGRTLMGNAARNLLHLSLELGGHAPFLVFPDADPAAAVSIAMAAKFRNGGQTCICPNRFLVHREIHDAFVAELASRVADLRSGFGRDETTDLGPLIDDDALRKVETHVADAIRLGARVVTGGGRRTVPGGTDRFPEPTVLVDVTPDMRCWREETFGPVCPVRAFDDDDEAISMANDSDYGLAAYAVTEDSDRIARVAASLRCGIIGINDPGPATALVPFGGVKQSGFGREGGRWGLQEYLEPVTISHHRHPDPE